MFSLYAKKICDAFLEKGSDPDDFLVPNKRVLNRTLKNYGLFHDRIVIKADQQLWLEFEKDIVDRALLSLSSEISANEKGLDYSSLKTFLKTYAVFLETEQEKPLLPLFNKLNTIELYNIETSDNDSDLKIKRFLENVNSEYDDSNNITESSFLKKFFDLLDYNGNLRIPSIVEISTFELRQHTDYTGIMNRNIWCKSPDESSLFEAFQHSFQQIVRNYHKYICILRADGDGLGSVLTNSNDSEIRSITSDLTDWGEEAFLLLKEYGALPVYIGGDDLLCFAPVNNGKETILELANKLSVSYRKKSSLKDHSISVGISISYYKSPMYESYETTYDLLKKAKKKGNSCVLSYEKHSGSPHIFSYEFDSDYVAIVQPLLNLMEFNDNEKSFLSSVMYCLRLNEELLHLIKDDCERIWYFFINNFDEASDKKKDTVKYRYLKLVAQIIYTQFGRAGSNRIKEKEMYEAINNTYSLLKTTRFLKGLDDVR